MKEAKRYTGEEPVTGFQRGLKTIMPMQKLDLATLEKDYEEK